MDIAYHSFICLSLFSQLQEECRAIEHLQTRTVFLLCLVMIGLKPASSGEISAGVPFRGEIDDITER